MNLFMFIYFYLLVINNLDNIQINFGTIMFAMDKKRNRPKNTSLDGFLRPSPRLKRYTVQKPLDFRSLPSIKSKSSFRNPLQINDNTKQAPFQQFYLSNKLKQTNSRYVRSSKRKLKWSTKRKVITSALIIMLICFSLSGWYGSRLIGNMDKVLHGNVFSDAHAFFSNTKLKGENQGRVNILLAGDSTDDPNHGGAQLTDSIMVVSINTKTRTGFMLSIPRDLWVYIPGWSHQKINAANDIQNFSKMGYPKGGMGQLEQIIHNDLGIPIDYYALINYAAFKDAVNSVGGITINIQSPDPRGLFDPNISKEDGGPLKLPNGKVTLNGQTALNLARARGDPCSCGQYAYGFPQSDYNRTQHQRQMLKALMQKAQSVGVLANPIKISGLFNSFGNNILTDLNLQDILRLIQITKGMNVSNLRPLAISDSGPNALLTNYTAPDGEEALIPKAGVDNFSKIQQFYKQLSSNNPKIQKKP